MNYKEYTVIVYANGTKHWYLDGQLHRENGPAVEKTNGHKEWWIKGQLHREDGPAIECVCGETYYYIYGRWLTKGEYNARTQTCDGKIIEIEGKKYKLSEIKQ